MLSRVDLMFIRGVVRLGVGTSVHTTRLLPLQMDALHESRSMQLRDPFLDVSGNLASNHHTVAAVRPGRGRGIPINTVPDLFRLWSIKIFGSRFGLAHHDASGVSLAIGSTPVSSLDRDTITGKPIFIYQFIPIITGNPKLTTWGNRCYEDVG